MIVMIFCMTAMMILLHFVSYRFVVVGVVIVHERVLGLGEINRTAIPLGVTGIGYS